MGCGLLVTGAGTHEVVENQIDQFTKKGNEAYSAAMDALQAISQSFSTKIAAAGLDLKPDVATATGSLPTYQAPTPEPEAPDLQWTPPENPSVPPEIDADYSGYFSNLKVPTLTEKSPTLQFAAQPSRLLPTRPDDPDPLQVPVYPEAPQLQIPELPPKIPIQLPKLPDVNLDGITSTIAALRNNLPKEPSVPQDIGFIGIVNQLFTTMQPHINDAVSGLLTRINAMLGGGTGLPTAVALALRNRAFFVEDRLAAQAEQTAIADWLARGFTLPGGALEVKLAEIRQQNRDKKEELNLNLWIEEAKFEIENLRFAVQQGIAYEAMRKDALVNLYRVAGDLASKAADVQLKLVDAAVNIFQAKAQMWQMQFSTLKDEIQAELAKVEVYKAELEGQKLIGDLNQQDIDAYKARLDALMTRANLYKTEVDAVNSLLQAELGKLQYAAEKVKLYVADVGAWETEWKAYGEAITAESGKTELFKGIVQGFSAETEAYARGVDAAKTQASLKHESLQLKLQAWTAQLEKNKNEVQAEATRLNALSDVYKNQMGGYALKHEGEKTRVSSELQKLDYLLNVDRFNADVEIKKATLEQEKLLQLTKIAQDALDAVARTAAQLAGSAMGAMNVGASISAGSSISQGHSCSESYSYEG